MSGKAYLPGKMLPQNDDERWLICVRGSGILMHITSLPGPYGVGTMGKQAFRFVDFLERAGQSYWQILPLSPTGYGDSPYQSCSTFAGNHYLIDLDLLVEEGLLGQGEPEAVNWGDNEERVDFAVLYENRLNLLRKAYDRFADQEVLDDFCAKHSSWLPDFALFMALKAEKGGKPWYEWEEPLKHREPEAVWQARRALKEDIRFYCFVQYLFFKQWTNLRAYAHNKGITLIGDVPIYVPYDSADVWADPELFYLDEQLQPVAVAGCPPDAFGEDGQLWGNPLYRWSVHKKDGYRWGLRRLAAAGMLYDVVRLDHFRGFEAYWAVPFGDVNARGGQWMQGPGMDFFEAVKKTLPQLALIAEDLGFLTPEVVQLRIDSGYPGMKVLGFAFDSLEPSDYLPHTYIQNTVCYTGTHDNMTTAQWFASASQESVDYAVAYMGLTKQEGYVWGTIRTALSSVSDLCMIPLQDYLELGAQARMNFPGTTSGANWTWRALPGSYTEALADKIRGLTQLYGRLRNKENEK